MSISGLTGNICAGDGRFASCWVGQCRTKEVLFIWRSRLGRLHPPIGFCKQKSNGADLFWANTLGAEDTNNTCFRVFLNQPGRNGQIPQVLLSSSFGLLFYTILVKSTRKSAKNDCNVPDTSQLHPPLVGACIFIRSSYFKEQIDAQGPHPLLSWGS